MSMRLEEVSKGALVSFEAMGDGMIFDTHQDDSVDIVFHNGQIVYYCPVQQLVMSVAWTRRAGHATAAAIRVALQHASRCDRERSRDRGSS